MAIKTFSVGLPEESVPPGEWHGTLEGLISSRPMRVDDRGRAWVRLPAPFRDVKLRDGEQLRPGKALRLVQALEHFGARRVAQERETDTAHARD